MYCVWESIPCEGFMQIEFNTWNEAINHVYKIGGQQAVDAIERNGIYNHAGSTEEIIITSGALKKCLN
jgi:hypothetical protein